MIQCIFAENEKQNSHCGHSWALHGKLCHLVTIFRITRTNFTCFIGANAFGNTTQTPSAPPQEIVDTTPSAPPQEPEGIRSNSLTDIQENLSAEALVDQETPKEKDCSICFEPRHETYAFGPCGHASFCKNCALYLFEKGDKRCPTCRATITNTMKIFFQ